MSGEERDKLIVLQNTLNKISICGYENIIYMLGSMNAVIKLIQEGTDDGDIHAEQ